MNYVMLNESAKVEQVVKQAEEHGMPRTHQKFDLVNQYLTDLERNRTGAWPDEIKPQEKEGLLASGNEGAEGGMGAGMGAGMVGAGGQGQGQGYEDGQNGSPYGSVPDEGGLS